MFVIGVKTVETGTKAGAIGSKTVVIVTVVIVTKSFVTGTKTDAIGTKLFLWVIKPLQLAL